MASILIDKKDVYWSYIGSFFRLASNVILLPFMLHFLSDEDLGLWYVYAGIAQFVVLLDFGFAPALSRNISYIWCGAKELKKENLTRDQLSGTDFVSLKILLTTCRYIYLALAIIAFFLLAIIGTYFVLSLDCSHSDVLTSWFIYMLGVVLNLYYSYFTSFLRGVGALAENNIAGVYSKTVQIVISCILLYCGLGILGASLGYFVSGIVLRFYSIKAFYRYDHIGESLKRTGIKVKIKQCRDMFFVVWYNSSKEGLIMLSNYLSSQANTLICSSVLGLATTGSYGISVQLSTIICGISNIPYTTYQPKMMEKILKDKKKESLKLFSGTLILFFIVYCILSVFSLLLIPVITWLKPSFSVNFSMMLGLLLFMFVDKIYHDFASYISNSNKLPYTYPFVVSSIISLLFSYILASYTDMGIWALIIAPLLVAIVYNVWKWPSYVLRDNNVGLFKFSQLM